MNVRSIAFVDDHPILLNGLANLFKEMAGFDVVATGVCAEDVPDILRRHRPDILVMDLNMPGDAFRAIAGVAEVSPGTRTIAFTASASVDHAVRAIKAGAKGYLLKGSTHEEMLAAIDAVWEGGTFISPSFAGSVFASLTESREGDRCGTKIKLSVREEQVVRLLLGGRTNREIGETLHLQEKTIKHYMTLLMQKLEVRNRVEVALAARRLGLEQIDAAPVGSRNSAMN